MKPRILLLLAALGFSFQAFGQPIIRQASDTEVSNGSDVHAYVNPRQMQAIAGSGPTNGMTQAQHQGSLASGTNNYAGTNATLTGLTTTRDLAATSEMITQGTNTDGLYFGLGSSIIDQFSGGVRLNITPGASGKTVIIGEVNPGSVVTSGGVTAGALTASGATKLQAANVDSLLVTNATTINGTTKAQAVYADSVTVTNTLQVNGTTATPTLNATNFFDYGATNGANQTNFLMLNTNGAPQYGVVGSGLSWDAPTRTLSASGSSAPNGLVTNNSPLIIAATNSGIQSSNTVNHQSWRVDTNGIVHLETNGVEYAHLGTNTFYIDTSGFNGGTSSNFFGGINYMQSNAAPFITADNPTNQYLVNTLYTNGAYRGFLVGEVMVLYTTTQVPAINLNVTNGSFGYTLFFQHNATAASGAAQDWYSFCIPLSPRATFKFVNLVPSGTLAYPTNTTFWIP
jgi:hypothetical protein